MATLVYKMTHRGDPNQRGCWGVGDCMGQVRDWDFNAVIGIGGRSWYPRVTSRAGEIVWIGIGPHPTAVEGNRGAELRFDHFRYFWEGELMLRAIAPNLAQTMYHTNRYAHFILHGFSRIEELEIEQILELARNAAPSSGNLTARATDSQEDDEECRRRICRPIRRHMAAR